MSCAVRRRIANPRLDTAMTGPPHTPAGTQDYPLAAVPREARRSFGSLLVVLTGFTFFTATMFAGGQLGGAFPLPELLLVLLAGNLLLGSYVAALGYAAQASGLNTALMGRFAFGELGSRWPDLLLGGTQICWYGWGTATIAVILLELLGVPADAPGHTIVLNGLMILFGIAFCLTAYVGYRGLELLSLWAVPAMTALLLASLVVTLGAAGGPGGLARLQPTEAMTLGTAITLIFGTFSSGGTQSTNWTRFARSGRHAILAALLAFGFGNGLMLLAGALGALVYRQPDIVQVLVLQGLATLGIAMLFLNIWTTQDNTIYNFSVAGCDLLRSSERRRITLIGALLGTLLGLARIDLYLVPFLLVLGTLIPPIGGVILADFRYRWRGCYPALAEVRLPACNWAGLGAYALAVAVAFTSPGVAPVNGILAAAVGYVLLDFGLERLGLVRREPPPAAAGKA